MKVCHLTSVHPADDIRIFVKECQSLRQAGHEVFLVAANADSHIHNGIHVIGVESRSKSRFTRMIGTTWKVYKESLKVDADVYHFHDPELIGIALLLKKNGKKVIYDVHEDVPEQVLSKKWIPIGMRKIVSVGARHAEKFASKRFDSVIAATPTIANRFKMYNPNTFTVHNFPIVNELSGESENHGEKEANFLYIGGITALRGVREMAKAIELLNETHKGTLTLAGHFSPKGLKEELKNASGWRHIDHKGWLGRNEIKTELSKAVAGLVLLHPEPRYKVSYPIKLFEYMSAGIPAIASHFPLWREFVEDNQCGICVDPLDPSEIRDAMKWMIEHPIEARKMGENGRRAVIENFNWERESERLIQMYQSLEKVEDATLEPYPL
ncbi:glycosyltransferase family 4 protein [Fictibacillus gelatini]|uniref:glycosyltransferase family 4 protein n=1 Tax=Fictibacillus gelatini TaxID=225985 RepID=UPI00047D2075|nr:glycosyltransferase family 4 protein [Fictibacillus gelatini]